MTIKNAVKELGLSNKKIFTSKELDMICEKAKCELIDVMRFLRFGR